MEKATVIVIGGGATGVGILRDLAMRGVDVLLIEKCDLVNGASSRYHGLLHSGGRYAVKDQEAARECIIENRILRKIGRSCVEPVGGMFVRLRSDDPDYEEAWVKGCAESGIDAQPITMARRCSPTAPAPSPLAPAPSTSWAMMESIARCPPPGRPCRSCPRITPM